MGLEHIKKTKSRLLEVKTNKEYEAALKEIDAITEKNSIIEDEIIDILDAIEATRKHVEAMKKELADYRATYDRESALIDKEFSSIDSNLADMTATSHTIREQISPDIIKKYDVIRTKRNGHAVVPVWKEVCEGCHMNIPPQLYNELQKTETLISCPNCNRIIYWENREAHDL
jgi:predicted  nucleic acid-binding Zn-ribbon protein